MSQTLEKIKLALLEDFVTKRNMPFPTVLLNLEIQIFQLLPTLDYNAE